MDQERDIIVVSDLHLTQVKDTPGLWQRYRHRDFAADKVFVKFADHYIKEYPNPTTFIFNGDTFDFDGVVKFGTRSTKRQSIKKIKKIMLDHPGFFEALERLIKAGHSAFFTFGNHDLELAWKEVQFIIRKKIHEATGIRINELEKKVKFYPWFYYIKNFLYVEHGNQYDPYNSLSDVFYPLITKKEVEIPFGSLTMRHLNNQLGYFNPYVDSNFDQTGWGYLRHFFKYYFLTSKSMLLTGLLANVKILIYSIRARKRRIKNLFKKDRLKNSRLARLLYDKEFQVSNLKRLMNLRAPSVFSSTWRILYTLWLEKTFFIIFCTLVILIIFVFLDRPWKSALIAMAIFLIAYSIYSIFLRRFRTDISPTNFNAVARKIANIVPVKHIVMSHTHNLNSARIKDDIHYWNTGTWASAFYDAECSKPVEDRYAIWRYDHKTKRAGLFLWKDDKLVPHK